MKGLPPAVGLLYMVLALSACSMREEMAGQVKQASTAGAKVPATKVAPIKASGDVGLLDLEKNYLILVTKEGKLITADFTGKTNVTKLIPEKAKMSDINLGQAATVTYTTSGDKKIAQSLEYVAKAKK